MIKRLQQIAIEKTVNVQLKYMLNESVIDKNFIVIIDCLKELQNQRQNNDKVLKSLDERNTNLEKQFNSLRQQLSKGGDTKIVIKQIPIKQNSNINSNINSNSTTSNSNPSNITQNDLDNLRKKIEEESDKNKKSNIENLKDINLLLNDLKDVKNRLSNLEDHKNSNTDLNLAHQPSINNQENLHQDLENIRIVQNQMQRQLEEIKKLQDLIDKLKRVDDKHDKRIELLEEEFTKMRDNEERLTDHLKNIQNMLDKDRNNNNNNQSNYPDINQQKQNLNMNRIVDEKLNKIREWMKNMETNVKDLQDDVDDLKNREYERDANLNNNTNNTNTNTGSVINPNKLEEDLKRNNRRLDNSENRLTDLDKRFAELHNKLEELEIMFREREQERQRESANQNNKTQKQQKLPTINNNTNNKRNLKVKTPKEKDRQQIYKQSTQKSNADLDKKFFEMKIQLQQWVKQLIDARNNSGNRNTEQAIKQLQLKIQQIKMMLEKKAEQEGVKKYLTYLENKINQIYIMLSQPGSEDALIARKGWGCLSCAKKLEKYSGKLGQHVNWNNLTTANYSPPRVGFTQTYKSSDRNRFVSMAERNSLGMQQEAQEK